MKHFDVIQTEEGKKKFGLQFDEYTAAEQHLELLGITITCLIKEEFRTYKAGIHKIAKADDETICAKLKDVLSLWGLDYRNLAGVTWDGAAHRSCCGQSHPSAYTLNFNGRVTKG